MAFGHLCFPYLSTYNNYKIYFRPSPCIFLGYSLAIHSYWCLDPRMNKLYIARNARFNEPTFPFHSSSDPLIVVLTSKGILLIGTHPYWYVLDDGTPFLAPRKSSWSLLSPLYINSPYRPILASSSSRTFASLSFSTLYETPKLFIWKLIPCNFVRSYFLHPPLWPPCMQFLLKQNPHPLLLLISILSGVGLCLTSMRFFFRMTLGHYISEFHECCGLQVGLQYQKACWWYYGVLQTLLVT